MSFPRTKLPELLEFLNTLGEKVTVKYHSLNKGGCGVYAAEVAQGLQSLGVEVAGIAVKAVCSKAGERSLDELRGQVSDTYSMPAWEKEVGVRMGHTYVVFRMDDLTFYSDSIRTGVRADFPGRAFKGLYQGTLTVAEMVAFSRHRESGWNSVFDMSHKAYQLRRDIRGAFRSFALTEGLPYQRRHLKPRRSFRGIPLGRLVVHTRRELKRLHRQLHRLTITETEFERKLDVLYSRIDANGRQS